MTKREWIIAVCSSGNDEIELFKFIGTKEEVKVKLLGFVLEDACNGDGRLDSGTESVDEIDEINENYLTAYNVFSYYHINYVAYPIDKISNIPTRYLVTYGNKYVKNTEISYKEPTQKEMESMVLDYLENEEDDYLDENDELPGDYYGDSVFTKCEKL